MAARGAGDEFDDVLIAHLELKDGSDRDVHVWALQDGLGLLSLSERVNEVCDLCLGFVELEDVLVPGEGICWSVLKKNLSDIGLKAFEDN